jgi:hypothetical protein
MKQQNHYIFNKDSIQMQKQIPPILKRRTRSMPPTQFQQSNKENLALAQPADKHVPATITTNIAD